MRYVISLDPGKDTGICTWRKGGHHDAWYVPYDEALEWAVAEISSDGFPDLVVVEDFVISERTVRSSSAGWRRGVELEFIGVVRWMCRWHDVEFQLQRPDEVMSFSTDAKLRAMGWWTKGKDHSRAASRHMLRALVLRGVISPSELAGKLSVESAATIY